MREARQCWMARIMCVLFLVFVGRGMVMAGDGEVDTSPAVVYVDALYGDNENAGDAPERAFATIRQALRSEAAEIRVYPGVYREHLNLGFRSLVLQGVVGAEGAPVLEGGHSPAVIWDRDRAVDPNTKPQLVMQNFIIRRSPVGVVVVSGSPDLKNLTIVECGLGVMGMKYSGHPIRLVDSSILWNNSYDIVGGVATYCCLEQTLHTRGGNIFLNPLFADAEQGDYRLRSRVGRYRPDLDQWVQDEQTSPCIDTGRPFPFADFHQEPLPNGERINMGAFGGSAYASMSEGRRPEIKLGSRRSHLQKSGETYEWELNVDIEVLFGKIVEVRFYMDGELKAVDADGSDGWQAGWTGEGLGLYHLYAVAKDATGLEGASGSMSVVFSRPSDTSRR